jgi:putative spermidine/putrescine transport system permease protein
MTELAAPGEVYARKSRGFTFRGNVATFSLTVLPAMGLLLVFFLWPLVDVALRSLSSEGTVSYSHPSFYLGNYTEALHDHFLLLIEWRTVKIGLWATLATTLLAFPTAYFISRLGPRMRGVLLALVLIPFWVSIVVRLFALTVLMSNDGVVNHVSRTLGIGTLPLLHNTPGTIIGMVNYLLPYMILVLYAGMANLDLSLLTAARTLGASGSQVFGRVYLPLIRPALFSAILLIFIISLSFFLTPAVLGGAHDRTVAVYIQQQIDVYQWGSASALGIILLGATLLGYAVLVRVTGAAQIGGKLASSHRGDVAQEPFRLTSVSVLSGFFTLASLIVLLAPVVLVFPMSVGKTGDVLFPPHGFTLHWYGDVFADATWTAPVVKSLVVASCTAVLATALSLGLARTVRKIRSNTARAIFFAAIFAPIIAPVILLAIGEYDVQIKLGLDGSRLGLVFAHAVIALPLSFAILATAMANLDPALEPAAWTLGASRTRAFWTITVPAIRLSLIGAAAVAFVASWDEVVIALFQTGLAKTLPVTIFAYLQSGVVPAVPAVAAMLIALVLVGFVGWWTVSSHLGSRRQEFQRVGGEVAEG